jgi:hypothetical protein
LRFGYFGAWCWQSLEVELGGLDLEARYGEVDLVCSDFVSGETETKSDCSSFLPGIRRCVRRKGEGILLHGVQLGSRWR